MEIVLRQVVLPTKQSFIFKESELKYNKGVIHTHEKYELNYIIDAYGRRFVGGNIQNFYPGDLVLMGPDLPHCWEIDNKEDNPRAYTVHFRKEFFEEALSKIPELSQLHNLVLKSKNGILFEDFDLEKVSKSLETLNSGKPNIDQMFEIFSLLRYLLSIKNTQELSNKEFEWNADLPQNQRLRKIYEYVFYNFQNNIQLSQVADLIGLSEGAFCSFFKKNTKKTFSGFIKEVRIGYACKLLNEDTDRQISEICFDSGFNNFANFNRQFKELVKMSPREYRLSVKK